MGLITSFLKPFFLGVCFLSTSLVFAQRVVDNGGGMAEMQAIYFHQNLGNYIRPCLTEENICKISLEFKSALQYLLKIEASEKQNVKILFSNEPLEGDFPFLTEARAGSSIYIFTHALYGPTGVPIFSGDIAAIVLAARLSHCPTELNTAEIYRQSIALLSKMTIEKDSLRIDVPSSTISIHDYRIGLGDLKDHAVFLEDQEKSRSLSLFVKEKLPCGELRSWSFENWRGWANGEEVIFMANANSDCSPNHDRYVLVIEAKIEENGLLAPSEPVVSFQSGF